MIPPPASTPEERYQALVDTLIDEPGVSHTGRGFGATALKRNGKIFAMLASGRLVLKLPAKRIDELIAAGEGERYDAGKARPMREWFALSPSSNQDWLPLSREALAFAGPNA